MATKKTPEPKTKVNMVKSEEQTLVIVELIGTFNELIGEHTLFHSNFHITFINGSAEVTSTTADQLRKLGMVK